MDCRVIFLPDGIETSVPAGTTISLAAKQTGVFIDSPCGGNGTCGKCEVTLTSNGETRRVLACRTRVESDCAVTVHTQNSLSALDYGVSRQVEFAPYPFTATDGKDACFACFDLGTTTIVCYLLDAKNGGQIASAACQNPQSAYGADVIARADYALSSGHPEELKRIVTAALNELIRTAAEKAGRTPEHVSLISIVGNTVMLHLLLGFPADPACPRAVSAARDAAAHTERVRTRYESLREREGPDRAYHRRFCWCGHGCLPERGPDLNESRHRRS